MLRRIIKWLLWSVAVLIFILIIGAAGLWLMPRAVSTNWAKEQLETRFSRALHAPVAMDGLRWTWEEGIQIQGLRIADDQAFSRDSIISLDRLRLDIDPGQLIDRRLCLNVQMEGLKGSVIRGADGRTNLESWLARFQPAGRPAEETRPTEPQDWRKMSLALPGDLSARIRLQRGALLVEDRQANRSLAIRDIALLVDIPSLVSKPVTMTLSSQQEMDGNPLPPVDLTLSIKDLADPRPAIQFRTASINARCRLPGLDLSVAGGLSDMGIAGKLNLDLGALMTAAGPLVPPALPSISGKVVLDATAHLGEKNKIAYGMTLSGDRLMVGGGPLKENRIGPVDLLFTQAGTLSPEKRALDIAKGELRLQEKTRIGWEGRVRQANASAIEANLSLADIALDLKEMAGLAGPFLPMDITAGWSPERPQGLSVDQVRLNGIFPAGAAHVTAKGLAMDLPGLELARAKGRLSAEGIHLRVAEADVRLQDRFPASLHVIADLDIQGLRLSGDQPIHVHGLKVADIHMTAKDLAPSPKALLGVAGTADLTESLTVEQTDAPGLASISAIRHGLKASVLMQDQPPWIKISAETVVESRSAQVNALSKHPIKGGMRLEAQVADLDIEALTPIMADVGRLEGTVRLGDVLDVQVTGEAAALGETSLSLNGRARIDLNSAAALIPASMKPKGTFGGVVETSWRFEGRRPTHGEQETLSDEKRSPAERLNALGFINAAELNADLRDVDLDLPTKDGASLSVQGIRSASPLTITLSRGLKSMRMEGDLAIGRISGLPVSPALKPPLSATLSFKINQEDFSSLQISEALHIDHLEIDQDLQVSINRLGRLLNSEKQPTLSTLLMHLDVSVAAGLRTTLGPSLTSFTHGLALTGPLNAGVGFDLTGGKELSTRVSLKSGGLDVIAPRVRIKGLTSHIHLSKTYGLQFEGEDKGSSGEGPVPLSHKVLRPSRDAGWPPGSGNALARRLVEDLGGPLSGPPALSFDSISLKGGPFPLELRHGEMQLRLAGSLPSLDRFQLDAMGGSILADLRFTRKDDLCRMEMKGAFSGLDATTLIREQAPAERASRRGPDQDTQVSGQVSLQMPVSSDSVRVMNNLSGGVHLTHIGSRTLERFLYAMDPYEANEGIVQQRALLRKGAPEWVDLTIRHGNLSLSGSVTAMGARIPLPQVERLNLTGLPIHHRLQQVLGRLGAVENALKALSSEAIMIQDDSTIRFVENRR